jgi:hypothetical protein
MSVVSEILGRAMSDAGFRALLLDAPEEALASYELSEEQRTRPDSCPHSRLP